MKRSDIALILVAAIAAGILSLVVAKMLFVNDKNLSASVEVVDPITDEFKLPDSRYFNPQSINPTQLIRISENANQLPFSGNKQ